LSAPSGRELLDHELIMGAIFDAADIGFDVLSVSGGEPLLYRHLRELLVAARTAGLQTQIVTNGWMIGTRRYEAVSSLIDLVAVSLDGLKERHNQMRGSPSAFNRLERCLGLLSQTGQRFGIVHMVSDDNWHELFDVAEYAARAGASLFQIHMRERSGRSQFASSAATRARAFIIAAVLNAELGGQMTVHIDLQMSSRRSPLCDGQDPAAAIGVLVLEEDGTLVPMSYGFNRAFALGNIGRTRLASAWPSFVTGPYRRFLELRREVDDRIAAAIPPLPFNRFETMNELGHEVPASEERERDVLTFGSSPIHRFEELAEPTG
jgi:MoaA/NifB/PqqE/SkfB family radical SAM enzyme